MSIQTNLRSTEQLREELAAIDVDLGRLAEQEREADAGIDGLALRARRGDVKAKKRLDKIETTRIAETAKRRRLEAAREAIKGEIQQALATADHEAARERMREARKIVDSFRGIGREIDDDMRRVLENYKKISIVMAQLTNLGVVRFSGEVVRANVRRAMRSSLISIHRDLEMALVPPLERKTFDGIVTAWVSNIERMIAMGEGEASAPQVDKAQA
jgi:vacuolar-type H+-ATPase subunit E/Vma4